MWVSKITDIKNYRNLTGTTVNFSESLNFIVGQNNVGKTNLLQLFYCIFNMGRFIESDFNNIKEPIEIVFQVKYSEDELGYFEDSFDSENKLQITIIAKQESVDDRIEFQHKDSEVPINSKLIRGFNFIYYSSLRIPSRELNFIKNVGTGRVLNYLMKESFKRNEIDEEDLIKMSEVDLVINDLNRQLEKLNGLSSDRILTYINQDNENLVNRILEIGDDSGRSIDNLGDGLQFTFNIFLSILELIVHLKTVNKEEDFEKLLINNKDGKAFFPIIIGLDEPELHQHPYRQRALIKSIRNIIENLDKEFLELVKSLFGIDGFIGQVFVVTHSPNILLNNYKEIVRLHSVGGNVKAISGSDIELDPKVLKHLIRSYIYIKEAMFSKSVLLVEGDTEFGALPVFIERLGYDIDEQGLGVIKLDGADSVIRCLDLYKAFDIPAYAIIDKDKEPSYSGIANVYFTKGIDFEDEVFDGFAFKAYMMYLREVNHIKSLIGILKKEVQDFDVTEFLRILEDYDIPAADGSRIMKLIKTDQVEFLRSNKTAINGALLAAHVDKVPDCFKDVIKDIIEGL